MAAMEDASEVAGSLDGYTSGANRAMEVRGEDVRHMYRRMAAIGTET
jgi:hypothetical protein